MRLPLVSRRRYEAVKAERDRLRREETAARACLRIRVKADMREFEDALERVRQTLNRTGGDDFARLQENASRIGRETT